MLAMQLSESGHPAADGSAQPRRLPWQTQLKAVHSQPVEDVSSRRLAGRIGHIFYVSINQPIGYFTSGGWPTLIS
jgi:hypothetical protein